METVKKVQEDKDLYEKLKCLHGRVYDAYQVEKRRDKCLVNFDEAEKEKCDFVSGNFIECRKSFNEFKENNSYWLEYIGDDTYIGRSDNILNHKFHITPRQLFTLFTKEHFHYPDEQLPACDEKQCEQKPYSGVSFKYNGHTWGMCARDNGVDILLDKQLFKHLEKQDEQKPTDEEMKILLQTEYEKGKADAIEAAMESVTKDKESAIKFLKSAGIMNENGELAKEYVVDNIEQNHAWSEDDEEMFDAIIADIQFTQKTHNHEVNQVVYEREIDWLKSIKDRVQQQNK